MNRRARADVEQFRDQILAELRDAPRPLSTRELADRLLGPSNHHVCLPPGVGAAIGDRVKGQTIVECHGIDLFGNVVYVVSAPAPCAGINPHLRALEALGTIIRLDSEQGDRTAYWAFLGNIGEDDERQSAQLEALWELPSAESSSRPERH